MEKEFKENPNYIIYSDGRIYSKFKKKFMRQSITNKGYLMVSLYDGTGKRKFYLVHRLVAMTFIPNPDNKPCVDHLDGNRLNCNVNNLCWVTYSENNMNPITRKRNKQNHVNVMAGRFGKLHPKSIPVLCYSTNGIFIAKYDGLREASRQTNVNRGDIGSCCRGKRKTAGNYIWKYDNI